MRSQDWLYNYRYRLGIERSLAGVVRRAKYLEESDTAYILFNEHYDKLKNLYELFFPELKSMTVNFLKQFNQ
jgi:acyl carrier protein phosphodiesterase